ncbi:MAG TPA: cytochrome C oxidase subunit I [Burkholderiales bacterium]|nr:cytochrome C oxidase subunit I [Burkholderiales bacterium]
MSNEKPKKSLLSLWLLIALCAAPVAASYLAYYFWQPSGHVNYGELIEPRPLPDAALALTDGTPFPWHKLKGKWVLAIVDSGNCDAYCQRKLLYLRQARLAQGKEMDRIERAWLIADDANPAGPVVAEYQGTWLIRAAGSEFLSFFPAQRTAADHIYIIDPLGNLMMRFPRDADPQKMVKDIARLLRTSGVG